MLFVLSYISYSAHKVSPEEMESWLEEFRAKNVRLGITGLLVCQGNKFCQFLEGEEARVRELFGDIKVDGRHIQPTVLSQMPIQARAFGNWAMAINGFASIENYDLSELPDPYRAVIRQAFSKLVIRRSHPD